MPIVGTDVPQLDWEHVLLAADLCLETFVVGTVIFAGKVVQEVLEEVLEVSIRALDERVAGQVLV